MENNVYSAPESDLVGASGEDELASRWKRLGAAIVDGIVMSLITLPVMYLTGGFDGLSTGQEPSIAYSLGMGLFGIVVFIAINARWLVKYGQTVGKKVAGIKIVELSGDLPSPKTLLVRYAVYIIPGQVPLVGQLFSLINILFIFGKQKRCVHDYAAGTKVILG
ncbi:RDD family protein [Hahella ganghwensis]|uniref:RDD family protein n=1 Tax=Hahella ganghwensis TaxID=286420 RepID=UPI0003677F1F|nr:RDD family protein [Hahella ganghwensis]